MRVILASTAVAPLGDPRAGGVDHTLRVATRVLAERGHRVTIVAPAGSTPVVGAAALIEAVGELQPPAQEHNCPPEPAASRSALGATWRQIVRLKAGCDVVVNFSYDLHPFEAARALDVPVGHHLTMGLESAAVAAAARAAAVARPGCIATYSGAQAAAHGLVDCAVLGIGVDLDAYCEVPRRDDAERLVWAGRVAAEKRPQDAIAAAARSRLPLDLCGPVVDEALLDAALRAHPAAEVRIRGRLPTAELAAVLGGATALLMTPAWEEALGIVAVEALACGTPVVAYDSGGIAEVVDASCGVLVPHGDVEALVAALDIASGLCRRDSRRRAEERFGLSAYGDRWEAWLRRLCGGG